MTGTAAVLAACGTPSAAPLAPAPPASERPYESRICLSVLATRRSGAAYRRRIGHVKNERIASTSVAVRLARRRRRRAGRDRRAAGRHHRSRPGAGTSARRSPATSPVLAPCRSCGPMMDGRGRDCRDDGVQPRSGGAVAAPGSRPRGRPLRRAGRHADGRHRDRGDGDVAASGDNANARRHLRGQPSDRRAGRAGPRTRVGDAARRATRTGIVFGANMTTLTFAFTRAVGRDAAARRRDRRHPPRPRRQRHAVAAWRPPTAARRRARPVRPDDRAARSEAVDRPHRPDARAGSRSPGRRTSLGTIPDVAADRRRRPRGGRRGCSSTPCTSRRTADRRRRARLRRAR